MVLDLCTNGQQKTIPKNKKLSVNDNIACCQDLLLNQTIVDNHIFRATKIKLNKYSCCHEDAIANGTSTNSKIVPFAADTLGNFCSVSIILLKALAKIKFSKTPGSKEQRELAASVWVNTTCRDIQTAIIKTCAYTNRFALKCAFRKEYNELYPGTIYSPPSYNDHFSSTEG